MIHNRILRDNVFDFVRNAGELVNREIYNAKGSDLYQMKKSALVDLSNISLSETDYSASMSSDADTYDIDGDEQDTFSLPLDNLTTLFKAQDFINSNESLLISHIETNFDINKLNTPFFHMQIIKFTK